MFALLTLAGCALVTDAELASRMDLDGDGWARPDDCDDGDAAVGLPTAWYVDGDGDGFGGQAETLACRQPTGFTATSSDCDDGDPAANPAAVEICDVIDNDCDGATDEDDAADAPTWYFDGDEDGYGDSEQTFVSCGTPAGYVALNADCDDGDPTINPGERETCDGRDEDCSGLADDPLWYPDGDADGYGQDADPVTACDAPDGYAATPDDCDDTDAAAHPGAAEVCDEGCTDPGCDEDCDGLVDDDDGNVVGQAVAYGDADGDGFGDPSEPLRKSCELTAGYAWTNSDCDDADPTVSPAAEEVCYDGVDANCDGASDDDCDADGFDDATLGGTDCDDTDERVHPNALEACSNDVDENCDDVLAGACGMSGDLALTEGVTLWGLTRNSHAGQLLLGRDVTDDGVEDLLVGAPQATVNGYSGAGVLYVMAGPIGSGASLSEAVATFNGSSATDGYGYAVAVGDFDGDGDADLATGSPDASGGTGAIGVFLGPLAGDTSSDDAVISLLGDIGTGLCSSLGAADLDDDGFDDLAVGVDGDDAGLVYMIPGETYGQLFSVPDVRTLTGEGSGDQAGSELSTGDQDGDGVADVWIGAPQAGGAGAAYLVRGPVTASLNLADADVRVSAATAGDAAGTAVSFAGDTDGDGRNDLLLSAPGDDLAGANLGVAYLFSQPLVGDVLLSAADASLLGSSDAVPERVAGAGDVNGDTRDDVLVGAPSGGPGQGYLLFGPVAGSWSLLDADAVLSGQGAGDQAGYGLAGADLDGDGYSDVVVGAPYAEDADSNAGAAYILAGGE